MDLEREPAEKLWSELRVAELANRRYGPSEELPAWSVVALGAAGYINAVDVACAVERLTDDAEWRRVGELVTLRAYASVGAMRPASDDRSFFSAEARRAEALLLSGEVKEARRLFTVALDEVSGAAAPLVWLECLPAALGMAVALGDYPAVIELCERAGQRFPTADFKGDCLLQAACAALATGAREGVAKLARSSEVPPSIQRLTGQLEERLKAASAEPNWVHAGEVTVAAAAPARVGVEGAEVLRRVLGGERAAHPPTSLAGLRSALETSGCRVVRCSLTVEKLTGLLEAGASVIVAEERSSSTGFARLVGYEKTSGLLLVERFDGVGAVLRIWDDQARRCALYGFGCVAILPDSAGSLASFHDARLDALDASEADLREAHAGRGRTAHLSAEAVALCPEVPRAWQLRGEALAAQARAGELEGSPADGPLEAWYAEARSRFEVAEWAHQTYAEALESWSLVTEAAIAWADALSLDHRDYRNALGLSRNRLKQGYGTAALHLAGDALARAPDVLATWEHFAVTAFELGRDQEAARAAALVLELDAKNAVALRVRGVTLERKGELAAAAAVHAEASVASAEAAPALRAALAAMRLGRFEQARDFAVQAMQRDPTDVEAYLLAARAFRALGNGADVLGVLEFALSRVGPESELVTAYASALCDFVPDQVLAEKVARVTSAWTELGDALLTFADALFDRGERQLAEHVYGAAAAADQEGLNPPWRRAKAYVRGGQLELAEQLLKELTQRRPHTYFVILSYCVGRALGHEAPLEDLGRASADVHPALVFGVTQHAAARAGDASLARALEQRLFGLPADALVDAGRFLADHRLFDDALALLDLAARHPRAEQALADRLRLEQLVSYRRGEVEKACSLSLGYHREHADWPVADVELAAATQSTDTAALRELAQKRLDFLLRGANQRWSDGMRERALLASVAYRDGDASAFDTLLEQHRTHQELLKVVHGAYGRARDVRAERIETELEGLAPGLLRRISL